MASPDTFAAGAARGAYYHLVCTACYNNRQRVTATEMVERGYGDVAVAGVQERFRCSSCGVRGKTIITLYEHQACDSTQMR